MYKKLLILGLCFGLMNAEECDFRESKRLNKEYKAQLLELSKKIESVDIAIWHKSVESALWFMVFTKGMQLMVQTNNDFFCFMMCLTMPLFSIVALSKASSAGRAVQNELKIKERLEIERTELLKIMQALSDGLNKAVYNV